MSARLGTRHVSQATRQKPHGCPAAPLYATRAYPAPWLPGVSAEAGYQLVAVTRSTSPIDSSQRSTSMAALQPSPAAVTAWR